MSDTSSTQAVAPDDSAETTYADAQRIAARQQRKEVVTKIKELRRQADAAKERARKAQARLEMTVALCASEKPESEVWYEHTGVLPRKTLLEAAGLSTVALHRLMERHRKTRTTERGRTRRTPRK
jgi:hypothetical protein